MLTSEQVRAARAMIRWTAMDLSQASGLGVATIRRLELDDGVPTANASTLKAIQDALEKAGLEFVGSPNDGPGVRLRKTTP